MTSLSMLLTLADSRLPTGGHVHSGAAEEAITSGLVRDMATLELFLRRRIRTSGLVAGSLTAAVCRGELTPRDADDEYDARTPSPAARTASRAQGRGLLRLAKQVWPEDPAWSQLSARPHHPVVLGIAGRAVSATAHEVAAIVVYTTMTTSAIAAQRLLALNPADVATLTIALAPLCDDTADIAAHSLADLSDPLLDVLAQAHDARDRPLFAS